MHELSNIVRLHHIRTTGKNIEAKISERKRDSAPKTT